MTDIKIAVAALESDAKAWDRASTGLSSPANASAPLELNGSQDVMLYGADAGIDQTYNDARSAIEDLLEEAARYFTDLATTLRRVAAVYVAQEEEGTVGFRQQESEMGH